MDLVWLLIPAAVGLFALRTWLIARRLRLAAEGATAKDTGALRDAKAILGTHHELLLEAVAAPKQHLAAAKELGRTATLKSPPISGALANHPRPENRI